MTINHYCCNRSAQNFRDPHAFVPERWLGEPMYAEDKRDVVQPFSGRGSPSCLTLWRSNADNSTN